MDGKRSATRLCRKNWPVVAMVGATVGFSILFGMEATNVLKTTAAIDTVRRLGGSAYRRDVCFDDGIPYGPYVPVTPRAWPTRLARSIGAEWIFDVVHVDFRIYYKQSRVSDADLTVLSAFPNLLDLDLSDTAVTDDGMQHLVGLRRLRYLDLRRSYVTDEGLRQITGLKELKFLYVDGTKVTRRGIESLKSAIPSLKTSPIVGEEMADWDKLHDEVEQFLRSRTPSGNVWPEP